MRNICLPAIGIAAILSLPAHALQPAPASKPVENESLFGNVVEALSKRFYDESFRESVLPELVKVYRDRATAATSFEEHRDVVQKFLSNIPATHLALISDASRERMMGELGGRAKPTFGFELIEYDGKQYAFNVLEGGPAATAGLLRGDRIMTVDGILVDDSPRLGWRTDDAFLPDPPVRDLLGDEEDVLKLRVERTPGKYMDVNIPCQPYSSWEAGLASARVIESQGKRIGHLHLWHIHMIGPDELLKEKLEGDFASCDAFVLDLRGRGGSGFMVPRILDVLDGTTSSWNKPVVALINGHSRSAKEVIAYELRRRDIGRLVGEHTAGAVIPASMADVGFGMHLMFPTFTLPTHTENLEFKGVEPDVVVSEVGPYSAGADPIFEAGVAEAVRLAMAEPGDEPNRKTDTVARVATKGAIATAAQTGHAVESPPAMGCAPKPTSVRTASTKSTREDMTVPAGHDPEALKILEKMVDALGGEKALRRHTAKTIRGERNIGGMIDGTYEVFSAAPSLLLQRTILPGMGRMEVGYNGSTGWQDSPHDKGHRMDDEELQDLLSEADFYAILNYKKHNPSIYYAGLIRFGDRDCHDLRLTTRTGSVESQYIDAETFLPIGWKGEVKTNMGPMDMTRTVKEFKNFDGEMVATEYHEDIGGMMEQTTTISEVSFDRHKDGTFDPPKDVDGSQDK